MTTVSVETTDTAVLTERSGESSDDDSVETPAAVDRAAKSPHRLAVLFGTTMCLVLVTLVGWLGFRAFQSHQVQRQQAEFLEVGRQGALDLTTIDWQHADSDIQRILNAATGPFYDEFSKRSQPFVDVVKKAQSTSVGTVTAAGVESSTANDAKVLVAVSVKTSTAGAPESEPRGWRMRISVQKTGGDVKVSDVVFVP